MKFSILLVPVLAFTAMAANIAFADPENYGQCSILMPGQLDSRGSSCSAGGAFAVAYNGYFFQDSPCYSNITDAVNAMHGTPECLQPPTFGQCSLVYPGQQDNRRSTCSDGAGYGVAFNGYFFSDTPCYTSMATAMQAMQAGASCNLAASVDHCSIVMPGQLDSRGSTCSDAGAYAVAYDGYFFQDSPCYTSVDAAISAMNGAQACHIGPAKGHCSLVYPGQKDNRGATCSAPSSFGVAFDGYFASDTPCYASVTDALGAMDDTRCGH